MYIISVNSGETAGYMGILCTTQNFSVNLKHLKNKVY